MTTWMQPILVQASGFTGRFKLHFKDDGDNQSTIGLTEEGARYLLIHLQDKISRLDYASGKSKSCPYCLEYWGEQEKPRRRTTK